MSEDIYYENDFMNAKSVDELRAMEQSLYKETFHEGKLIQGQEGYYEHQMKLFVEAFAALFPDDYDFHKKNQKPEAKTPNQKPQ